MADDVSSPLESGQVTRDYHPGLVSHYPLREGALPGGVEGLSVMLVGMTRRRRSGSPSQRGASRSGPATAVAFRVHPS